MITPHSVVEAGLGNIGFGIVEPIGEPSNLYRGVVARALLEAKGDIHLSTNTEFLHHVTDTLLLYTETSVSAIDGQNSGRQKELCWRPGLPNNYLTCLYITV